ncbi:MAG: allantoicase [Acidimicrobiia bacterium]
MRREPKDLLVDLASDSVGGRVLAASDELLGAKEELLRRSDSGSGWETKRRRRSGHDWAIISLGLPGVVRHVVVDTTGFAGRHPTHASVESIHLPGEPDIVELARDPSRWIEIVPRSPLAPDRENDFVVVSGTPTTHVRLVVYPDGGIAGFRLLGDPIPPGGVLDGRAETDLAAIRNGARVLDCSGAYLSSPNGMLAEDSGGWLTHRRRTPGHEWAIVRLAGRTTVTRLEVDATGLDGNAPESIAVEAVDARHASLKVLHKADWRPMLAATPIESGSVATLTDFESDRAVTHLRLSLYPDGGITRFRAFGVSEEPWTSPD